MSNNNGMLALLPVFAIAISTWFSRIFVLDRFIGLCKFNKVELYGLFLSLLGGIGGWIATLSTKHSDAIALQIVSSVYRSFINWLTLVLIINEQFTVSKQQLYSLVFSLFITVMWEIQNRLILSPV